MIRIVSTNGRHQYDTQGRAITTWDEKKCTWIINSDFEHAEIDWWGEDNDFPAGETLAAFEKRNPDWNKIPDITATWYWNTKESCIKAFGFPRSFGQPADYWDKQHYPYSATRAWGYIDEKEETTVERFGKYCDFHRHADRVVVTYNGKVLHDGILK
jgi:hypothetical protein